MASGTFLPPGFRHSPATFNDDVKLEFGDAGDSQIYFNGSDTYWDLQATGTGGLTIALGDTAPAPDQDSIHIWKATAGTVTAASNTLLTLENSGDTVLQLLHGNSDAGVIYGGGQTDTSNYHGILMRGSGDSPASTMTFRIADDNRLNYSAGAFAFQEATELNMYGTGSSITNVGASGNDWDATGLQAHGSDLIFTATAATGTNVHYVGGNAAGLTMADNTFFTFSMGNGGLFTVTDASGRSAGVFAFSYNSSTMVAISDPESKFVITNTDSGDKIAVFTTTNSHTATVKNYTNDEITVRVYAHGDVYAATAIGS